MQKIKRLTKISSSALIEGSSPTVIIVARNASLVMRIRPVLLSLTLVASITSAYLVYRASRLPRPGRLVAEAEVVEWKSTMASTGQSRGWADSSFRVRNAGGTPIRISTHSSCGCAKPKAEPETLGPGESGLIVVSASPNAVGVRDVPIDLETDSPATPSVRVIFRLNTVRNPPFLLRALGDLSYLPGDFESTQRTFKASTIESKGSKSKPPVATCDLSFLKAEWVATSDFPYSEGTIHREHTYRLLAEGSPEGETFVGTIRIRDPWDGSHFETLPVHGVTARKPVTITPAVAFFPDSSSPTSLLVRTLEDCPGVVIEPEDATRPLDIERDGQASSASFHRFKVSLRPGSGPSRTSCRMVVRKGPGEPPIGFFTLLARSERSGDQP